MKDKTRIPHGFYSQIAQVIGAKVDQDGNPQILREEISRDELLRRYQDEMAKRAGIQVSSDYKSPEQLLTEGYQEIWFSYDWLDYDNTEGSFTDEELNEQSSNGGWSFRLPSFLHRKSHTAKPTEVEPPLAAPKRNPQATTVKAPRKPKVAGAPKAPVIPPQNPVTGGLSAPTTNIHYSIEHKRYSGVLHGKTFGPMPETTFYSHLIKKHGFSAPHAERFISNVRAGSTSGFEKVTAQNHLDHAHRFLELALTHHHSGDHKLRDKHMEYVHHHLDKGYDTLERHLKRNPKELSLGRNHPIFHQVAKINAMMHHFGDI
jgi:hypothetical protein